MAILRALSDVRGLPEATAATRTDGEREGDVVRVGIHDASRVEWSVTLPLPKGGPLAYSIDVEMRIPSNAFARHSPWDQLQAFTRLDGQGEYVGDDSRISRSDRRPRGSETAARIDGLRRAAIAVATQLARRADALARRCRAAKSVYYAGNAEELLQGIGQLLDEADTVVVNARRMLVDGGDPSEARELIRERRLVDEYVSVRLLDFLGGASRTLSELEGDDEEEENLLAACVGTLSDRIGDALGTEIDYRKSHHFLGVDAKRPGALERYLDRASLLKKHFQEVLFLEAEVFHVAERMHHAVASIGGIIAGMLAFFFQMFVASQSSIAGRRISAGLFMLAGVAGLLYAVRDRVKEIGRSWISGRVHRFYAQRVATYRAPARRIPGRDIVARARESFDQEVVELPDPLNPTVGATQMATRIHYVHKGVVQPSRELSASGVDRVKHVFRYDLSPLFARLDDAVKQVPIFDEKTRRVRFIDAPRCYRVPVAVTVVSGTERWEAAGIVVLHKRGLERIETTNAEDALELEPVTGLEPT
jgi:hypothetical protein